MAEWYAQIKGQRYGPVGEQQIRDWLFEGRLAPTDVVWSEGMSSWVRAVDMFPEDRPSYSLPHRGSTVLTLGILGLVVTPICGIIAWVMANNDLRQMDAGQMDPAGRGSTQSGKTCGMISVILACVAVGILLILLLIGLAAGAAAAPHMRFP